MVDEKFIQLNYLSWSPACRWHRLQKGWAGASLGCRAAFSQSLRLREPFPYASLWELMICAGVSNVQMSWHNPVEVMQGFVSVTLHRAVHAPADCKAQLLNGWTHLSLDMLKAHAFFMNFCCHQQSLRISKWPGYCAHLTKSYISFWR